MIINNLNYNIIYKDFNNHNSQNNCYTAVPHKKLTNTNVIPLNYKKAIISFGEALKHAIMLFDNKNNGHSTCLLKLSKALSPDTEIEETEIESNKDHPSLIQVKDLLNKLKRFNNSTDTHKEDYIALPSIFMVSFLNLSAQINTVKSSNITLTPENIKNHKKEILEFLKDISEEPDKHKDIIKYLDPHGQGIEYLYATIQEINKAVNKGYKVYVAAGNSKEQTLKWMCKTRGVKPELYNYISTGIDTNNTIRNLDNELQEKNWYDFNLFSLSDAIKVGITDIRGNKYLFSAEDSMVDEYVVGTYNLSPVRKNNEIIGYSFTDEVTPHYTKEEIKDSRNIEKFVGLPLKKFLADRTDHQKLKEIYSKQKEFWTLEDIEFFVSKSDKLFKTEEIFNTDELDKIKLRGDYADINLKLFFRENKEGKVIFPNCDCEGSGKPSICSMWGTCLGVIRAITDSIKKKQPKEAELNLIA